MNGFAVAVDICEFQTVLERSAAKDDPRLRENLLRGAIAAVETLGGQIVSVTGSLFVGLVMDVDAVYLACCSIAKGCRTQCQALAIYDVIGQSNIGNKLPSARMASEYGQFAQLSISSRVLGVQDLVGQASVDAMYLSRFAQGEMCLLGPAAAKEFTTHGYPLTGPKEVEVNEAKPNGPATYYELHLRELQSATSG